jgi:hypothetical protein
MLNLCGSCRRMYVCVILAVSMENQSVNVLIVDGTTKVRSAEFLLIIMLMRTALGSAWPHAQ